MKLFILLLAFVSPSVLVGDYTVEDLKKDYAKIFQAEVGEHGGRIFFTKKVTKLPQDHVLADFVNDNHWLLDYLQNHGTGVEPQALYALIEEPERLKEYYHSALVEDESFNALLLPLVSRYLQGRGGSLVGFDATNDKRPIALDELLSIAVRFFYPDGLSENGLIRSRICTGINGLRDFEGQRDLAVEAFSFETIFTELRSSKYRILDQYKELMGKISSLQLSTETEIKITRAQGAAWALLSANASLREMLLSAYEKKKEMLPFVVVQ